METILYSSPTSIVPPQKPQYPSSQLFFKPKYVYQKHAKPTKYYHFNLADPAPFLAMPQCKPL